MSKFVDETILSLKQEPENWLRDGYWTLTNKNVSIYWYGNTRALSVIDFSIDDERQPISYFDAWKLEVAVSKWYKNISISHLCKKK